MITAVMKRAGIALSAIWLIVGGYISYRNNSYQDHWANVEGICRLGSQAQCEMQTAIATELFAPEWVTISFQVLGGLAAIWLGIFIICWVKRGSS